ncbi:DNA polymerase epsilon subunit 4 [Apis mellifera caucasica]|uniref:DNA polymerase epsilon subunit 4 n=1 Tax=Apis mellifera TaxID=7460 RepID=A0A7M7FZQ8_APIME|nr:DNA polymerase epsilon subunit 4 [Apis mellifera]XP_016767860.1 DNA polymerase epsilon subunit 4 [Apis mellifera]KAG6799375.1 DNA polymerase epsilon subunit 4 [Apis mellifera caucasica]KAG9433518.1 DNA polymerase epsilon subunit 4 [Apis mellifera carnica]|eukprot:XP_001121637.3 DNA polymerase epsilon subunit 4 [Apis mellifera]
MKSICIIMAHFEEEESVSDKELNESTSSIGKENSQEEIENNARIDEEQKEKLVKLPLGRIKTIIKMDPEVHMVNQEAVFLITKSTELFIDSLAKESYKYTAQMKKKTIQKRDVESAINNIDALVFLEGMLD